MIQLERHKSPQYMSRNVRATNVKRALPFVASDAGEYVHRVRSAVVYEVCGKAHMAVSGRDVRLDVHKDNPARKIYARLYFEEIGESGDMIHMRR